MVRLIIKGNKHEAALAAANHGIPFAYVMENHHNETIGHAHEAYIHEIMAWYCEDVGDFAPFPKGTLLHYSH